MTHPNVGLLLLLFLLIVLPVWGWLDMKKLKRDNVPAALTQSYLITITAMWLLSAVSAFLVPAHILWRPPQGLAARMKLNGALAPAVFVAVALMIGMIVPVIIARRRPGSIEKQLEPIRFLLPATMAQRWIFVLVCLTAGIAEEWIYRGFVLHFLVAELPALNGWIIVVAAAAMFGIAHAYQGRAGAILTGILGVVFSLFYITTGNLLLSMVLHALLDLRILLLLPKIGTATQ